MLLYNIPGRTGANLEPATVLRLADIPNIIGIKESSGNMVQITELLTQAPRAFQVLAGDDALALPILAVGGCGLVSVASNAIPQQMSQMVNAALNDSWISARRINRHYFHLMQANFCEPSPAPIKAVMALLGRGNEELRLPMVPVTTTDSPQAGAHPGRAGPVDQLTAGESARLLELGPRPPANYELHALPVFETSGMTLLKGLTLVLKERHRAPVLSGDPLVQTHALLLNLCQCSP